MKKQSEVTPVKDGWIRRDAVSGQLIEVGSSKGVVKASPRSRTSVKEASLRRSAALKRLADR